MTNCPHHTIHSSMLPANPLKGNPIFIFSSSSLHLDAVFEKDASPCTKYITHSSRVISACSLSLPPLPPRFFFPWHRFLKFCDAPLVRNRPLSQKKKKKKKNERKGNSDPQTSRNFVHVHESNRYGPRFVRWTGAQEIWRITWRKNDYTILQPRLILFSQFGNFSQKWNAMFEIYVSISRYAK